MRILSQQTVPWEVRVKGLAQGRKGEITHEPRALNLQPSNPRHRKPKLLSHTPPQTHPITELQTCTQETVRSHAPSHHRQGTYTYSLGRNPRLISPSYGDQTAHSGSPCFFSSSYCQSTWPCDLSKITRHTLMVSAYSPKPNGGEESVYNQE